MLLKGLLLAFHDLAGESEIGNLQHPILDQNVRWLDIPMHEVVFIEFPEGIQDLGEVVANMRFLLNNLLALEFGEEVDQVTVVTVLQHYIYCVLLLHDVLDPDDMLILPQF